jgi:phospho-N-acetylmuramoyl-pentapeptide-transferase
VLYQLFQFLTPDFAFLNVTHYITFRIMVGLLTALMISFLASPWFIRKLKNKQLGQVVRDDGPKSHLSKSGTPTMGGGLILTATMIPALLWMDWANPLFWNCAVIFVSYGFIGFMDDYLKISKKNTKGVSGRIKLFWQIMIAMLVIGLHVSVHPEATQVSLPFFKNVYLELGWFYVIFASFVIVGTSNAVNLTDGLDGLAIGPVMIAASSYAILSYVSGHAQISSYLNFPFVRGSGELAIFASCIVGSGLGFLWYNSYPAQVFMGDVGSLPLGGALGALAVFSKHEFLLALIGGIFVAEAVSVIGQVVSFKLTGKRIFRMAPLHHHFELQGWAEPKVIVRFWIISVILALFALLTLKIR